MFFIKEYEKKYNEDINNFIISIYVEEFGFEQHRAELENQDNELYIKNGGNMWIAFNENEIIGTIAAVKYTNEDVELKKLYVRSDYRRKGVSKKLYDTMINWSKDNCFKRIFLGTYDKLENAINFYSKIKNELLRIQNIIEFIEQNNPIEEKQKILVEFLISDYSSNNGYHEYRIKRRWSKIFRNVYIKYYKEV